MSTLKETIQYRGREIRAYYDESAESPDNWGNTDAFIVYEHRQFQVTRKGFDAREIFEHTNERKKMMFDGYHVFVLNAYIHSGVALSLGRDQYPFTDRWDVSTTGYVLVKKEKGWSYTRAKAEKIAESIVGEWNQYLSGEVYGYQSDSGSCWGFYGDSGYEQMLSEAKAEIDHDLKDELTGHLSQLKGWIKNKVNLLYRKPSNLLIA